MTGCFIDSGLDHGIFLNSDISQGSVVMQLRCGEIISQGFVANLLVNLSVKAVWTSVNSWRSYGQYCSALFFWLTVYMIGRCCPVLDFCQVQNSLCVLQVLCSLIGSAKARHSSSGRKPNFAALSTGRHLHSAGRPSRWALAHILVLFVYCVL